MAQSNTLCMGMDAHKDISAVAYVAQDHGATVTYLGTLGARQGDLDHVVRQRPSTAPQLIFVSEAGPCGYPYGRSQRHLFGGQQRRVYEGCKRATRCTCMHGVRGDTERARGTSTTPHRQPLRAQRIAPLWSWHGGGHG
jgi:hypothetical protein